MDKSFVDMDHKELLHGRIKGDPTLQLYSIYFEKLKVIFRAIYILPKKILVLFFFLLCLFCILILQYTPQYIDLPLHPPGYFENGFTEDWKYSSFTTVELSKDPLISGRVYTLRKEGSIINKNASWESIKTFFSNKLEKLGWKQVHNYAPCQRYLPEAKFLKVGAEGYVYFRRDNYEIFSDFEEGDLTCLAIWKEEGNTSYSVTLLTAKPSMFRFLMSYIIS